MRGEVLIDGWPWGWGADAVIGGDKGWRCHNCGKRQPKSSGGPLVYGDEHWCSTCARERCQATYTRCFYEDGPWHSPWQRAMVSRGRRALTSREPDP